MYLFSSVAIFHFVPFPHLCMILFSAVQFISHTSLLIQLPSSLGSPVLFPIMVKQFVLDLLH